MLSANALYKEDHFVYSSDDQINNVLHEQQEKEALALRKNYAKKKKLKHNRELRLDRMRDGDQD